MDVTNTTSADGPATETAPDVAQLDAATLPPHPIVAPPPGDEFFIALTSSARAAMDRHTHSRRDVEVGGILLGRACRVLGENRAFLLIDAIVPALAADSHNSSVTFTADTWTAVHDAIDRDYPGATIVGWYHTHPNFGVFLSEMDVFIQRHFFDLPHQVAIVVDPVQRDEGGFIWRAGVPTRGSLHAEIDAAVSDASLDPSERREAQAPAAEGSSGDFFSAVQHRIRKREVRPSPFDALRSHLATAADAVGRFDVVQWIALVGLVALIVTIFAAMLYAWMGRRTTDDSTFPATQPTISTALSA